MGLGRQNRHIPSHAAAAAAAAALVVAVMHTWKETETARGAARKAWRCAGAAIDLRASILEVVF